MTEIESFTNDLKDLLEEHGAKLYISTRIEEGYLIDADLCIDFEDTHSHTILEKDDEFDFIPEKEEETFTEEDHLNITEEKY